MMHRTALRLATVAALTNGGGTAPTMAGQRVYDSRNDPMNLADRTEVQPVIIVHTERDRRSRAGPNGRPVSAVSQRNVDLRLDFGLTTVGKDDNGAVIVGWPKIDSDLEALLDLFEYQIDAALFGSGPWAQLWQQVAGVADVVSDRFVTAPEDGDLRLAVRELVLGTQVQPDCLPRHALAGDTVPPAAITGPLKTVADAIAATGTGALQTYAARVMSMLSGQALPSQPVFGKLITVTGTIRETGTPIGEDPLPAVQVPLLGDWPSP